MTGVDITYKERGSPFIPWVRGQLPHSLLSRQLVPTLWRTSLPALHQAPRQHAWLSPGVHWRCLVSKHTRTISSDLQQHRSNIKRADTLGLRQENRTPQPPSLRLHSETLISKTNRGVGGNLADRYLPCKHEDPYLDPLPTLRSSSCMEESSVTTALGRQTGGSLRVTHQQGDL